VIKKVETKRKDIFFPNGLAHEMKPIEKIETKFVLYRKQNTYKEKAKEATSTLTNRKQHSEIGVKEYALKEPFKLKVKLGNLSQPPIPS
jgi:hypothetical protein